MREKWLGLLHRVKRPSFLMGLGALAALFLALYASFWRGYLRFNNPSRQQYPIWGLDVSHHQGAVEWQKVKEQNFQFVFIKATEGGDFVDPNFKANWEGARAMGLTVGAYHFFTFCRSVNDQLANMMKVIPQVSDALVPTLDLEFGGNCSKHPTRDVFHTDLKAFIKAIKKVYGRDPQLYVTMEFFKNYIAGTDIAAPLWFRDVYREPVVPVTYPWTFWQFANRGRVDGVHTLVDLNVFHGDQAAFQMMLMRQPNR